MNQTVLLFLRFDIAKAMISGCKSIGFVIRKHRFEHTDACFCQNKRKSFR